MPSSETVLVRLAAHHRKQRDRRPEPAKSKTKLKSDFVPGLYLDYLDGTYLYLVFKGALQFVRDILYQYPGATGLRPIFSIDCGLGKSDQIAHYLVVKGCLLVVCCQTCLNSSRPPTRSLSKAL